MLPILDAMNAVVPLQSSGGGGGAASLIFLLVMLAFVAVSIAGVWMTFEKAGEPGWAAIIPIFNFYIMIKISGNEWWWLLLIFVPIVGFFVPIKILIDLAEKFNKGILFGIGLWLLGPIFFLILGFGDARYRGRGRGY